MNIKYDGMTFNNASEVKAYKSLMKIVCGKKNVDQKLEDELLEIKAIEDDKNTDFDDLSLDNLCHSNDDFDDNNLALSF